MKIKFIKDVLVYGVTHKVDEVYEIDSYDKVTEKQVLWCIGHGMLFPLEIGIEVELIN
jgi:hypothetical protein